MGAGLCGMNRNSVRLEKKGTPGRSCSTGNGLEVRNDMSGAVPVCQDHASCVCTMSHMHMYLNPRIRVRPTILRNKCIDPRVGL